MNTFRLTHHRIHVLSTEPVDYSPCPHHTISEGIQYNNRMRDILDFDRVIKNCSVNTEKKKRRQWKKYLQWCSTMQPCLQGLILGILIGGLILAVLITLWLTSHDRTTTTTTTVPLQPPPQLRQLLPQQVVQLYSTSTSTSATTTTTTSTTSTSTTSTTTTTQSSQLDSLDPSSTPAGVWMKYAYSYYATASTSLTLKFTVLVENFYAWYLDDVSVLDQASTQMLTNGNFENITSLAGWTSSYAFCGALCGLSTSRCHSSNQCYFDKYPLTTMSISQSFTATANQFYNVTFWLYLDHYITLTNLFPVTITITIS